MAGARQAIVLQVLKALRHEDIHDIADLWYVQTIQKLVVGRLVTLAQHYFEHLKEDTTLICKEKTNHGH